MSETLLSSFIAACMSGNAAECQDTLLQALAVVPATKESAEEYMQVLLGSEKINQLAPCIIDTLWLYTNTNDQQQNDDNTAASTIHPLLLAILQALGEQNDTQINQLLLTSLDATLLEQAGVLESAQDLQKKIRLYNTQQFYRQHKFNLLAEASEGYAKLLHLLYIQDDSTDTMVKNLSQLIGTFSLDPNRCLDLTLQIMIREPEFSAETPLHEHSARIEHLTMILRSLPIANLPKLVGFAIREATESIQPWLRLLSYLLSQSNDDDTTTTQLLSLQEMMQYLPTWQDKLVDTYDSYIKEERNRIRALSRVRLSGNTRDDKQSQAAATIEASVKELGDMAAIQWLAILLQNTAMFPKLSSCIDESLWVPLCTIFSTSIGNALCGWIGMQVKSYQSSSERDLKTLLNSIIKPLEHVKESGALRQDQELFSVLCQLFKDYLSNDEQQTEEGTATVMDIIKSILLPSLSIFDPEETLSDAVWQVLKPLPYETRYDFYRTWRGSGLERESLQSNKPLWLIESEFAAGKSIRYSLKRLSRDTLHGSSQAIAKVCHSHPLVVFTTILNQIESYDNLVQVMVDALHFVTTLSLDVLGFCILERLSGSTGGVNRSRLKEDGINQSQWLQSLENFTGTFYKRYPGIECRGILSYLLEKVKEGQVMDIGILRTLLKVSGGWAFADYSPAASLSTSQLEGRAGSTLLKRETMSFGVVEKYNPQSTVYVRDMLHNDDIGVSFLILLAQVKDVIIFGDTSANNGRVKPVKLIGNLVDSCQVTVSILIDFLTEIFSNTSEEKLKLRKKLATCMPSLTDLVNKYEMDLASAWMICRPLVRSARAEDEIDNEDSVMTPFLPSTLTREFYSSILPANTWDCISSDLLTTFFINTSYDLLCPSDLYKSEISRLEMEIDRVKIKKASFSATAIQPSPQQLKQVDNEEVMRISNVITTLKKDAEKHESDVKSTADKIKAEMSAFFVSDNHKESAVAFLCRCIHPRCMQGPDDALYCAKFVMLLHNSDTPKFGTIHFLDAVFTCLPKSLYGLTEGEASNLSILLLELWKVARRWRYDDDAFTSDVQNKAGSFMWSEESEKTSTECITPKEYQDLFQKWQYSIGVTALGCLRSTEYMHLRNCLIVLTRMVEVYPTRPDVGNKLLKTLEPLQEEGFPFADIKASAQAYSMQLGKARDDGVWCEEDQATVQARIKREKDAAQARQKKAEEQMDEIVRESKQISENLNRDYRSGGGGRDRRRPMDSGRRPGDRMDYGNNRSNAGGGGGRDDDRHRSPQRDYNNDAGDRDMQRGGRMDRDDRRSRNNAPDYDSRRRDDKRDVGRDVGRGGLDGRWEKPVDSRGTKRGRTSSPEPGEANETKRPRSDEAGDATQKEDSRGRSSSGRRGHRRRHGR